MSWRKAKMILYLLTASCLLITPRLAAATPDSLEEKVDDVFNRMESLISHTATRLFNFLVTVSRIAYSAMILLGIVTWLTGIWGGRAGTRLIVSGIALAAVAEFVAL